MEKRTRVSFKLKNYVSTSKSLKLLHLDILTPSRTKILGGNFYDFVIVDDFSRFTWTIFLSHKKETLKTFVKFFKLDQNQFNFKIKRSDHGVEFINHYFENFCNENSILVTPRVAYSPQQNDIVYCKNHF